MSPEQAAGKPADARSDIFSFGVVLYEALSGRQPFAGASDLEVLQRVQHQPAEPLGDEIPPALRMVVEKALEKDPAERYQSMRDMVVDLRRLARQSGETRAPVTRSRRGVALAAAALVDHRARSRGALEMRPADDRTRRASARWPCCRSRTCRAIRTRSSFPTARPKR